MSGYDTEYLPEDEAEPVPAPRKSPEPDADPVRSLAAGPTPEAIASARAQRDPRQRQKASQDSSGEKTRRETAPELDTAAAETGAAQETPGRIPDSQARRRALSQAVIVLSIAPGEARLEEVFLLHDGAAPAELGRAAVALTAVLLRARTERRPAIAKALAAAVAAFERHDLARALAGHLGALAAPSGSAVPAPPASPPAPVEDDGP